MIYAINILNRIRIATGEVTIVENISGEDYRFSYRPAILSITPPKETLSIEQDGQPEVPNSQVKIADADRIYFDVLNETRIDDIPVKLIRASENGDVIDEITMSITDLKYESGTLSFDLRIPESISDTSYMETFTPVTFQWMEIPQVAQVVTIPTWTKMADVPWKIIGSDYRRAYFESGGGKSEVGLIGESTYPGTSGAPPRLALTPVGVSPNDAYTLTMVGTGWERDERYPFRIFGGGFYDRVPINRLYQPYYGFNNIIYNGQNVNSIRKNFGSSYWDTPTLRYSNINTAETLFDGNKSAYYDFINNEFLANYGIYAAGYRPTYGEDIPLVSSGLCLLSTSTVSAIKPDYHYAQIGSTGIDDAEIFAYIIAGAGFIWVNSGGTWFWRSAGIVQATLEGRPIDNRMYHISGIPNITYNDPLADIGSSFGWAATPGIEDYQMKKGHNWREPVWQANTGVVGSDQTEFDLISTYRDDRHTFDRLIINTNNFTPDPDNDPDYSAGYMWLGQKMTEATQSLVRDDNDQYNVSITTNTDYKLFLRYKIRSLQMPSDPPYIYDLRDLEAENERSDNTLNSITLAELQIHNRFLDSDNDYGVALDSDQGCIELPDPYDPRLYYYDTDEGRTRKRKNDTWSPFISEDEMREFPIELYQLDFYVGVMKLVVTNLDEDTITRISTDMNFKNSFNNRYRGLRIDQVLNLETLKGDISSAVLYTTLSNKNLSRTVSVEEQSASILNNATERFGVIKGSSIVVEGIGPTAQVYEWLFFHIPAEGGYKVRVEEEEDPADDPNLVQNRVYEDAVKKFKLYTNKLSYRPRFNSALDQQRQPLGEQYDYGQIEANEYFKATSYRIIHDPVPENSADLGKKFPIIYGRVKRAPLMHVISKKTLYENEETAGDDVYIYASHPCDILNGHDIVVEYDVEDGTKAQSDEEIKELHRSNMSLQVAKSPFPSYEDNHTEYNSNTQRRTSQRLWLPYHALVEKQSITGRKLYGIQLRGAEWRPEAGKGDKRYPIRNGFGNSTLYFTAGGWVDPTGEIIGHSGLIEHPCDVLHHFVKNYGRKPYNENSLDLISLANAKSETPDYRVSIFMQEELSLEEFISKLCAQFCLFAGRKNDKIVLFQPNNVINKRKPLIDRLNIIGDVKERMDGYKAAVTEVTLRYNINYSDGSFKNTINLNPDNNINLARAARKLQNKNRLEIDADWIADHTTATKAALKMAEIFSSKRRYFNLTISRRSGIVPEIGDLIPMTCRDLKLYKIPCHVISIRELESELIELELLSFEDGQAEPQYVIPPFIEV